MPNQKYLCIQRSKKTEPGQAASSEKPSPAKMQEMYAKFNTWKEKFQDNIVDMGGRLKGGKIVTSEGATDGPFVEAKEVIGGYMIIAADSMEEAVEVAQGCPGVVGPGSSVEVREINAP
jgi:hypothetical protein